MSNLEILILYFEVSREKTFIDENHLQKNVANYMPPLNKFIFNIYSLISLKNQIYLPSNEDIQFTFKDFQNNQIVCCFDYFPKAQVGQCHVYSYPFTLRHYDYVTSNLPDRVYKCVHAVSLYDEQPFEHEFFLRIAESFPLMEKLTLKNKKP
jgi:hypothetical protein